MTDSAETLRRFTEKLMHKDRVMTGIARLACQARQAEATAEEPAAHGEPAAASFGTKASTQWENYFKDINKQLDVFPEAIKFREPREPREPRESKTAEPQNGVNNVLEEESELSKANGEAREEVIEAQDSHTSLSDSPNSRNSPGNPPGLSNPGNPGNPPNSALSGGCVSEATTTLRGLLDVRTIPITLHMAQLVALALPPHPPVNVAALKSSMDAVLGPAEAASFPPPAEPLAQARETLANAQWIVHTDVQHLAQLKDVATRGVERTEAVATILRRLRRALGVCLAVPRMERPVPNAKRRRVDDTQCEDQTERKTGAQTESKSEVQTESKSEAQTEAQTEAPSTPQAHVETPPPPQTPETPQTPQTTKNASAQPETPTTPKTTSAQPLLAGPCEPLLSGEAAICTPSQAAKPAQPNQAAPAGLTGQSNLMWPAWTVNGTVWVVPPVNYQQYQQYLAMQYQQYQQYAAKYQQYQQYQQYPMSSQPLYWCPNKS